MPKSSRVIPCPVCGGPLRYDEWPLLEGDGPTRPMIDCEQRHHALTEPHIWEDLRLDAWLRQNRAGLDGLGVETR